MASAASVGDEERCESAVGVDRKAQMLADRIRESKHFIVFTGAGISTSAGQLPIPEREPVNSY